MVNKTDVVPDIVVGMTDTNKTVLGKIAKCDKCYEGNKNDHEMELKSENWSVTKGLGESHYRQKGQHAQSLPMGKSLVVK